jgi:hypothetical protein
LIGIRPLAQIKPIAGKDLSAWSKIVRNKGVRNKGVRNKGFKPLAPQPTG